VSATKASSSARMSTRMSARISSDRTLCTLVACNATHAALRRCNAPFRA
jgi:hypothetical protein